MKEKLIIRNFGPIKDMTFEFRKVNIFIGDQGTGKSTVAKLYSAIRNFVTIPYLDIPDEKDVQFQRHIKNFGIESYFSDLTYIEYINEGQTIKVKYTNAKIELADFVYPKYVPIFTYIVAERVFVSILSDALYGIIETGAKLPVLFNRFGNKFTIVKKQKFVRYYKDLIGVDFTHFDGVDSIIIDKEENVILMSNGSSGMQGTIPMLVVYDSIVENISSKRKGSRLDENNLMVIEEPELNLFPETQKKIIDYIIGNNFDVPSIINNLEGPLDGSIIEINFDYFNKKYKNQLIITTHSPYILTSLNNLINAYNIGQKHGEEIEKIIEKKYWLNPSDVSAYMMLPDGTCEDIIDREDNLIKAEKIDGVSAKLNKDFDAMLSVEFGMSKKDEIHA